MENEWITTELLHQLGFDSSNDNGYTTDFYKNGLTIVSGIDDKGNEYFIEDKSGKRLYYTSDFDNSRTL